jgi:hypothetical protein
VRKLQLKGKEVSSGMVAEQPVISPKMEVITKHFRHDDGSPLFQTPESQSLST